MTYDDGAEVGLGDLIVIDGMTGTVLVDIDGRRGNPDWFYLKTGLVVDTVEAGLVHFEHRPDLVVKLKGGGA